MEKKRQTDFFNPKRNVSLHRELHCRLIGYRRVVFGTSKAGYLQARRDIPIHYFLVQILQVLVIEWTSTECLVVDDAQALGYEAVLPCSNLTDGQMKLD
jgi:hypothetical protein